MFRPQTFHSLLLLPALLLLVPLLPFAPLPNSPPVAAPDSYTRHGNGYIGPLLANDYDPENNPMSADILTFPTRGTLANGGGSNYYYSLTNPSWTGTDSFTPQAR